MSWGRETRGGFHWLKKMRHNQLSVFFSGPLCDFPFLVITLCYVYSGSYYLGCADKKPREMDQHTKKFQ